MMRTAYLTNLSDAEWSYLEPHFPTPKAVVERTFSWIDQNRRMSKGLRAAAESSEAFVYLAMVRPMVRRLACL
jgi:transposase